MRCGSTPRGGFRGLGTLDLGGFGGDLKFHYFCPFVMPLTPMRKLFTSTGNFIRKIIDFFYPPFRKYMSIQFFRYGACGASNLLFDVVLYFFIFNYILHQQMLHLGFVTFSSYIATLVVKFPITLLSGFLLQKYVTFTASELRGSIQLFRYLLVALINLLLNYIGLKLLVDVLSFYPSIANAIVAVCVTAVSYFGQKMFTFTPPRP